MKIPKLTIIVPVYKVEQYLPECIESILAQTFSDFELLLIDDGSPDNSGVICDNYAAKDERIRVIHKANGGVSSARNAGLDNANGEYIVFVDSDDIVLKDYLKHLYEESISGKLGLVVQGFRQHSRDGNLLMEVRHAPQIWTGHQILEHLLSILFYCGPWAKLFKREIVHKAKLRFDEKIHHCEDTLFVMEYLKFVDYVKMTDFQDYCYLDTPGSLTKSFRHIDHEVYFLNRWMSTVEELKRLFLANEELMQIAYRIGFSIFIERTFYYAYRPENFICKKIRIKNMKLVCKNIFRQMSLHYFPILLRDKISKYVLTRRFFFLFDFIYEILFYTRYKLWKGQVKLDIFGFARILRLPIQKWCEKH